MSTTYCSGSVMPCAYGWKCNDGYCYEVNCMVDEDCDDGLECDTTAGEYNNYCLSAPVPAPTASPTTTPPSMTSNSLTDPALVGVVIGSIVLFLLAIVFAIVIYRRKQRISIQQTNNKDKTENTSNEDTTCNIHEDTEPLTESNQISTLLDIIKKHQTFMKEQDQNVAAIINGSGQNKNMLQSAKNRAIETQQELLNGIMNINAISQFLSNIILIENLFNAKYVQCKSQQESAREQYAHRIDVDENKPKPICECESFVELLFAAKTEIGSFKKWLAHLHQTCKERNIEIISSSGAKEKNIERAFYKTYYVYAVQYGDNAHKQMTDVIRCALVFANFGDIYRCYAVIEELTKSNGGILRCKDRFQQKKMPFGYRDLLINIRCPRSEIVVCEIQLHHRLFYQYKKISHNMYKKARLFEDTNGDNLAYIYADQYTRGHVGDEIYDIVSTDNAAEQLLKEWGLSQYAQALSHEGYDDMEDLRGLSIEELQAIGFKIGHAKKLKREMNKIT